MSGRELIPRATIEEVVVCRNKALELYAEAFTAIEHADQAIKAAHAMARRTGGGLDHHPGYGVNEVEEFVEAVKSSCPTGGFTSGWHAVWPMPAFGIGLSNSPSSSEAERKLRDQMRYLPDRVHRCDPDGPRRLVVVLMPSKL